MPGLCGMCSLDHFSPAPDLGTMLDALAYGRATIKEHYQGIQANLGCAHLGTGGQRALYDSPQATVIFYGYLTQPVIPPGAEEADPAAAALYIHDQYLERGMVFLRDLMGAFAFALWDKHTHTLLLANDRLGMRPVYFTEHKGILRFASEVKALLIDDSFPHRADLVAASEFFHFRYILGDRTFFEDIRLLPPASFLCCRDGKWGIDRYWEPSYPDQLRRHPDEWYDQQIYETLRAAVERMIRSDLNYGISLSSGMDSRWIAAILSEDRPDTQTFTFGGTVTSAAEVDVAGQVAALTGLEHHYLALSPDFIAEHAQRMAYISDGMHSFVDSQEFPLTLLIGNHVDVAVGGFMGSGFFGQNPIYHYLRAKDVYNFRWQHSKSIRPPHHAMECVFGSDKYSDLVDAAEQELRAAIDEAPATKGFQITNYEGIRQRQRRFTFQAQLLKTPYVDMFHPIADNTLWELTMQFPPGQLIYKRALRRALGAYYPQLAALPWNKVPGSAAVSVPSILMREVYSRTKRLARKTIGPARKFQPARDCLDYSNWFRGPLRDFVEQTLLSPEANATKLFNPDGLCKIVRDHLEGRQNATVFLGLALAYALWTRMFYIPSTPTKPDIMVESFNQGEPA
jgi:asparagine synthetase B (glutamine-hydrolysing)